jgi:hypothetical protein
MMHESCRRILIVLFTSLGMVACRPVEITDEEDEDEPAKVEHFEGATPARVTLTEEAVKRLDIKTEMIGVAEIDGTVRRVIPYAAVLYDIGGETWTYTNPEPRVFVRHSITVDRVGGDQAVLSNGPPSGTAVVTVGAAELYGAESEFEEE